MEEIRSTYKILVGKPREKRELVSPTRRLAGNVNRSMDFGKARCECVN
jgi:hypothetical protein